MDRLWTPGNEEALKATLAIRSSQVMHLKDSNEKLTRVLAYVLDNYCGGSVIVPGKLIMEDRSRIPYQANYQESLDLVRFEVKDVDDGTVGEAGEGDGHTADKAGESGGAYVAGGGGNGADRGGGAD